MQSLGKNNYFTSLLQPKDHAHALIRRCCSGQSLGRHPSSRYRMPYPADRFPFLDATWWWVAHIPSAARAFDSGAFYRRILPRMPIVAAEGIWLGLYNDDHAGVPPSIAVDRSMLRVSLRRARQNEGFGIIIGVGTTSRWSHRILVTAVWAPESRSLDLLQVKVTGFLTDFPFSPLPIP